MRDDRETPMADDGPDEVDGGADPIVEMAIDGTLDLHGFSPKDVKELIPCYLDECRQKGIFTVRIIHGKGEGVLRTITHSALSRIPYVQKFSTAGHGQGGWGATVVELDKDG